MRSNEQLYLANSKVFLEALYQTDQQFLVDRQCEFRRSAELFRQEDYLHGYIKAIVN